VDRLRVTRGQLLDELVSFLDEGRDDAADGVLSGSVDTVSDQDARANAMAQSSPEILANRFCDATEENTLRIEDAETADRRDVLGDDVLCVGTGMEQTSVHESSKTADEGGSLIRLVEADLARGRR
jgi:hypothetical protein